MAVRIVARVRDEYRRASRYFTHDIWHTQVALLPVRQARRIRAARVLHSVGHALLKDDTLHVRAAALTYFTVLSLVPLLAFVFALLKGFGAYDALVQETIRPYVHETLSSNPALQGAFERILDFVDQTGVTSLGFAGLLTLLYAATRLLHNVEGALNELWGVSAGRDHIQQFRDYIAIIVVTPLCMMAAAALTTAGQALDILRAAGRTLGLSIVIDHVVGALGPLVALFMGLAFLYKAMPFVLVRVSSAAIGAAIGSLLWYGVLIVHVRFQVGVARFNALYSGFAALPIFLAWLQLSWLVVLIGGLISATHQNSRGIAEKMRSMKLDAALRESLCLDAVLQIARSFDRCEPAPSRSALCQALEAPESLLSELLDQVEAAHLIAKSGSPNDPSYVLARPPERVRLKQVLDALRRSRANAQDDDAPVPTALWQTLDASLEVAPQNRTLREVLDEPGGPSAPSHTAG